jgi:leader peptidase (prepilin peptidase)/N-methyltransferase
VSWDSGYPAAALLGLLLGALSGWWCPALIARIPEPEPEPEPVDEASGDSAGARPGLPPAPPKETYVHLAGLPGLARRTAAASALVGGVLGASVGWSWSLLFLLPLAPIGVALTVIDWRTTLLPTRLIAPAYAVTVVTVALAAVAEGDAAVAVHALIGWAVMGGIFFVLWFIYPRGLGYGDVRLSGVLGLALGALGWAELATGIYGAFLLGGVGGALLSLLRIVDRKRFPFGPFMLVAAVVAVALGPWVADRFGY